jgi:hypothetical protein
LAAVGFAVAALAATTAPAPAATIGQLAPAGFTSGVCGLDIDWIQPTVTSGTTYVVPSGFSRITSWSTNATSGGGQNLTFKVFRPVSGLSYMAVAHDGPHPLTASSVNTFPVNITVQPGDLIGFHTPSPSSLTACDYQLGGDADYTFVGDLADGGAPGTFFSDPGYRLNLAAEVGNPPVLPTATGQQAAALKKCKKKHSRKKRRKCRKKAKLLPV